MKGATFADMVVAESHPHSHDRGEYERAPMRARHVRAVEAHGLAARCASDAASVESLSPDEDCNFAGWESEGDDSMGVISFGGGRIRGAAEVTLTPPATSKKWDESLYGAPSTAATTPSSSGEAAWAPPSAEVPATGAPAPVIIRDNIELRREVARLSGELASCQAAREADRQRLLEGVAQKHQRRVVLLKEEFDYRLAEERERAAATAAAHEAQAAQAAAEREVLKKRADEAQLELSLAREKQSVLREDIARVEREKAELLELRAANLKTVSQFSERSVELGRELDGAKLHAAQLRDELATCRSALAEREGELARALAGLAEAAGARDAAASEAATAAADAAKVRAALASAETAGAAAAAEIERLQQTLAAAQAELADARREKEEHRRVEMQLRDVLGESRARESEALAVARNAWQEVECMRSETESLRAQLASRAKGAELLQELAKRTGNLIKERQRLDGMVAGGLQAEATAEAAAEAAAEALPLAPAALAAPGPPARRGPLVPPEREHERFVAAPVAPTAAAAPVAPVAVLSRFAQTGAAQATAARAAAAAEEAAAGETSRAEAPQQILRLRPSRFASDSSGYVSDAAFSPPALLAPPREWSRAAPSVPAAAQTSAARAQPTPPASLTQSAAPTAGNAKPYSALGDFLSGLVRPSAADATSSTAGSASEGETRQEPEFASSSADARAAPSSDAAASSDAPSPASRLRRARRVASSFARLVKVPSSDGASCRYTLQQGAT